MSRFRHVISEDHRLGPLLVRYRLISTRWGGLYLHHLLRSDADRHLHDHPWAFWSLILWRGYVEREPYGGQHMPPSWPPTLRTEWCLYSDRGPLSLIRHRATDRHALSLIRPAWSLVWVGPKVRDWGFETERGWIPWQEYGG